MDDRKYRTYAKEFKLEALELLKRGDVAGCPPPFFPLFLVLYKTRNEGKDRKGR